MPEFRTLVNRRYQELAQGIQTYYDELFTTAFYDENRKAIGKNFVRWSSNNNPMPGAPSSTLTQEKAESDWIENCKTLENWFKRRIRFLSGEWK